MNFHDYVSLAKIAKCILSSYQKELMQHLRQQHMDEVRRVIDLTSNVRKDGKLWVTTWWFLIPLPLLINIDKYSVLLEHPPSSKSLPNRLVFLVYHTFDLHFRDVVTCTLNVNKYSTWIMIEIDTVYCICTIGTILRVYICVICILHDVFITFHLSSCNMPFQFGCLICLLLQGMTYIAGASAKFQCSGGASNQNCLTSQPWSCFWGSPATTYKTKKKHRQKQVNIIQPFI